MRWKALILAMLTAGVVVGQAHAGRPKWKRGNRKKRWDKIKREVSRRVEASKKRAEGGTASATDVDMVAGGRGEKPLKWHSDFDAAAEIARRDKRPLMLLFTTPELSQKSRACTFAANRLRRAVRGCKAVPVKLLPPVRLSSVGVPKEEVRKREELHAKAKKRYLELARKYRITNGPALIFAAEDAVTMSSHVAPSDDVIEGACNRLGELIKAREKKLQKKAGAGGGAAKDPVPAKAGPAGKEKKPEPKREEKPVGDPDEDF